MREALGSISVSLSSLVKPLQRALIGLVCALACFSTVDDSFAQALTQGWDGVAPGGTINDLQFYTDYNDACQSLQGVYIPRFGYSVTTLVGIADHPESPNPYTGLGLHPAKACIFNNGTVYILYECSGDDRSSGFSCLPPGYPATPEPTACGGAVGTPGSCPTVGDPVSVSSGAKVEVVTDYTSGGAYPIEIKRYYRSIMMPISSATDGLGVSWRSNILGRQLETISADLNVVIRREDGARTRFLNPSGSQFTLPPGAWDSCTVETMINSSGTEQCAPRPDERDKLEHATWGAYKYTDENDRADTLTQQTNGSFLTTQTIWPGGYTRNYTYDANYHLASMTDSFGRAVTFTWTGNVITEIDLPDGVKLQYAYQLQSSNGVSIPGTELLTQVTRRKADGTLIDSTSYEYDRTNPVPLLTTVKDTNGAVLESTTYDARGRALTAQLAGGADYTGIVYDDVNSTRTVTNALGQVSVYQIAQPFGYPIPTVLQVVSISRQASPTVAAATLQRTYDSRGFLASRTDFNGRTTSYTNDSNGNETQRVEDSGTGGLARTTTTTWSTTYRKPTKIVAPNLTVDLTYDTAGRLTQRVETDTTVTRNQPTRTWTYTWTTAGLLQSVTGPRTDVTQTTSYTYDTAGNLATVTNALNQVTTVLSTNSMGLPTSVKDPNNVVTNLTYDPLGRLLTATVQGPTAATTTFGYDVNGLLTSLTTPAGVTLTYGYNAARQLTSMTDQAGNQMVFTLDTLGNHLQTQVVNGSSQVLMTSSATFDTLGRLLTSIGAVNQTTAYQYDGNSNRTRITDPRNAVTQNAFDGLNRLKQTTDALNAVTQIAYDGQDNITSITDPRLHATTYTVNGFGFVTQAVSPDSGTTIYTYDLAGNILSRKDARKITVNYTYDALNRIKTRTSPTTALNVSYTYDAASGGNYGIGRLTSLTDAAGSASFTYDAYGNVVSENRTISSVQYVTGYGYDLDKNLTQITYPSGLIVGYQRDAQGRVVGITSKLNATASTVTLASAGQYLPFGSMSTLTLGNGVSMTYSFDQDYRLTRIQAGTNQDLTIGYDAASHVASLTDAVSPSLTQTFQYDLVGRVTNGVGAYGNDTYTYDAGGNRKTRSLVNGGTTTSTTYTYTSSNTQLASAVTGSATLNYAYDANGALLTRKLGNTTQQAYTYNDDGRLATVAGATLKYNAFGQRQTSTVTGGGGIFIFGQNGLLLAEYTPAGVLVRNYIYLEGKPFALEDVAGNISYILNDQVAQPQKMLSASAGTVTWQRVAGIFGNTVSQPIGATSANPQRFPGQQEDPTSGLYYNYFRDYDPATGRYIEPDPVGLNGGVNLYAYVGNSPVNAADPSGRFGITVSAGGIAEVGLSNIFGQIGGQASYNAAFLIDTSRMSWSNPLDVSAAVVTYTTTGGVIGALGSNPPQMGNGGLSSVCGGGEIGGAYAGAGFSAGITNANSADDLSGLAGTLNANVGLGVNAGAQIARSNNGIWSASVTPPISSIGQGISASIYPTNTKVRTNWNLW
ncbi:MAG: hypothetical protein EOR72_20465 [Mesorhizobium sp.]|uniref:RHS repeat-associated core domain-containing protein n=1 Tax=Mesorhizobium sp. TaxID=1871066 RepID=UPI000FE95211|nr:RHS repeat-associated core domain-containing protein [Mesorhizobium sp.]RWM12892.1 MAG: hypothetical protein EOR72_20465 [Mesorhizobium sp.]